MRINTATGPLDLKDLGRTLMHEHLVVGFPGWDSDTGVSSPGFHEMTAVCVDRVAELKDAGFASLLDPCPNDLGRDVELMAEVSSRAGFNIIFATGLYHQALGGSAYWSVKFATDPDAEHRLGDLFIRELTQGVRDTGIKAGVIKVGTSAPPFTDYERTVFRAAARACVATGAPITTHTDAVLGDEQVAYLTKLGVPPHKIIVGHSCGSAEHDYHLKIVQSGAYVGFDRFGYETIQPDAVRVESLSKLLRAGFDRQIVISHDSVWCWKGKLLTDEMLSAVEATGMQMRFTRVIRPMLKAAGVGDDQLERMLADNPRRYFAGEPILPAFALPASGRR